MHNNRNNRETVIIPPTIIVPTKSIIVASLLKTFFQGWQVWIRIVVFCVSVWSLFCLFPISPSVQLCGGLSDRSHVHSALWKLFCDNVWWLFCHTSLIIVVIFQTLSVAWVYGADRYHKPSEFKQKCLYLWFEVHKRDVFSMQVFGGPEADVRSAGSCGVQYLWKYVCPVAMLGLLGASLLRWSWNVPHTSPGIEKR